MNWKRTFVHALLTAALLLGMLPAASLSQGGTDPTAAAKIEAELLNQLASGGTSDLIVVMAEQADLSPAYRMGWQERGEFVYRTLSETARRSQARAKALLDRYGLRYQTFIAGNELYVWKGNLRAAQALAALPEVASIRAPRIYRIDPPVSVEAPTPTSTFAWGILDTGADDFWASFGLKGEGIVVANIDTGVDYTHDALQPNYKCADNPSDPSCWYDPGTQDCTGPGGGPCDTPYYGIYHGTHVMGTMAAKDDPALDYTVGMAPNAKWIACLGCPFGSCPEFDLNSCADWMLAPGGDPDNRPHVVNNSWGGWGGNDWYLPKVQAWRAAGIFPAFSAGNSGPNCSSLGSPGDYQESFGSAAHDSSRNIAWFSSRGPSAFGHDPHTKPNISAPGVSVLSAAPGDSWAYMSGTSMASPHSAGAVALLWSCNPGLVGQIEQTFEILQDAADAPPPGNCGAPPDGEGNYTYGYGYLNIYQAGLSWCGSVGYLNGYVTNAETGQPIAGATVSAVRSGFPPIVATTNSAGYYTRTLPIGTYDVTASAYGYWPQTVTGVEILTDTVTTQNFALTPTAVYTVSGRVTDATTGWPLYARIHIDGYPYGPVWTDPVSGEYRVALAEGITYTFRVSAWVSGYLSASRTVGPLTGDEIQDFALQVDPTTCSAPGYEWITFYSQDFEASNGGFTTYGSNSTWEWGTPTTGPRSAHSGTNVWATNLDGDYNNNENSYLESPNIDLSALVGPFVFSWWQWLRTEAYFDYADVQVSNDGGVTWTTVYGPVSGNIDSNWRQRTVSLGPEYAVSNFRVRFHLYTDGSVIYPGWYVDDVEIYAGCQPQPGGLVVGNVYDANTGAALTGAQVTNDAGETFIAAATPDPAVDDAFFTLFSPAGDRVFTATMASGYAPDVRTVSVVANDTVLANFYLQAGYLSYAPPGLEVTLEMGDSATLPLTLTNSGGIPASFELRERDRGMAPMGRRDRPAFQIADPEKQRQRTTQGLDLPALPEAAPLDAGDVIQTWPTGLAYAWGLGYNHNERDLWLGDIPYFGGTNRNYRFLTDGTNTGDFIDASWSTYWAADMAYNLNTGMLWQVDVGSPGCIHELDPVNKVPTGNTICPPFGVSQRGLAYDPETDTFFAGSWNDEMIHRFASDGTPLEDVYVGLPIAGLAYNPDTQHLFVMTNDNPNPVYVLDVANNYAVVGQFTIPGFSAFGGAGLEMACDGSLWAVDQQTQTVYQVESGETTTMCTTDVPWLSENPVSGTVPPGSEQVIDVTFDAGVPEVDQPGRYYAQLKIRHDTPYRIPNVPITMTVLPPATWGKLNGTVTGLGYCDASPAPLKKARVLVESSQRVNVIVTLLSENFESWPPAGWSIVNNGGDCVWESTATTGRYNYAGGQGYAADADADWCGSGTTMDTELRTPVLDLSGYITAALDFVASYYDAWGDDDYFEVDVSSDGGATWTNVLHWEEDHSAYGPGERVSIDLTPFLSNQVMIRFRYVAPGWDWWAQVDQVRITAYGPVPVSWDLQTDDNGYYQVWLDESHSPLTVTVTAADHTGGRATGVMVTGGQTTTVDFNLRWLRPCVSVDPTRLEATVLRGTSLTRTLTLINSGAGAANFRFVEQAGTPWPPSTSGRGEWLYRSETGVEMQNNRGETALAYPAAYRWQPDQPAAALNILVYADDYYHRAPNTYLDQALRALGLGYIAHYGDWAGFLNSLTSRTWDIVLVGNDNWAPPDNVLTALNNYVQNGGKLIFHGWTVGRNPSHPLWATLGFTFVGNDYDPPDPVYWWMPDHLAFIFPERVPEFTVLRAGRYGIYGQRVEPRPGFEALAGYTAAGPAPNQAAMILGNGGRTVFKGFLDGQNDADRDGDGLRDGVELWINLISGIQTGFVADVPWLDEDPSTGALGADSHLEATITFTAFPTMSLGVYTATLLFHSNDPMNFRISVPVTMTVVDKPTCSFVSSSPDNLGQTTFFTSTTEGTPPISYAWAFGDGAQGTGDTVTHTYSLPGRHTAVLTATNEYGQDVCTGTVEVHGVIAGFTSNSPVMLGQPVVFTNTTVAYPEVARWFWTFGDGTTSELKDPVHTYAARGTYTVTLFASTVRGRLHQVLPQSVYDFYVDTVRVLGYGLTLAPASASGSGRPGERVTYTLSIVNTGDVTDTFSVAVSGNAWTTTAPATVGPVAPGASATFQVVVTVPSGALAGESDIATVTVTSQGDDRQSAHSTLVTRAGRAYNLSLTPETATASGNPGTPVVYHLTVTNLGNASDTFTVTVSGNAW
ncbi:MAG: S8 family serine peptidase, partial [Anaerolineae bacterium]|nr:S8 family serine peptidase [Anaerolineae bacterium]